jgi:hypothetical protein
MNDEHTAALKATYHITTTFIRHATGSTEEEAVRHLLSQNTARPQT